MEDDMGVEHCPSCDSTNVKGVMVEDKFKFGVGAEPVELSAQVKQFNCYECGEKYTGVQAEEARAEAVDLYLLSIVPQLVKALREQHHAIDWLFATMIAKTMHSEKPFYPSESGAPWAAMLAGKAAIEAAGGSLHA